MRNIKFRGLSIKENKWVYGMLFHNNKIVTETVSYESPLVDKGSPNYKYEYINIIPETIGQFTELHDKNGKEIYEGDLLQDFRRTFIYECVYRENGAFEFQNKTTLNFALLHDIWDNEVIGNVFENADLVKL